MDGMMTMGSGSFLTEEWIRKKLNITHDNLGNKNAAFSKMKVATFFFLILINFWSAKFELASK
jgi:hypothetical protein